MTGGESVMVLSEREREGESSSVSQSAGTQMQ